MEKSLLTLAVMLATLSSAPMALAFDFQELDSKIENGKITPKEAKQIVDEAIQKGEITQDQVKQHMDQMRKNSCRPGMPDRDEFVKKLQDAGITKEELDLAHQKGPDTVKQLFESHGIMMPPPPPPKFGRSEMPNKDEQVPPEMN